MSYQNLGSNLTRDEMIEFLREGECIVTFTKVDGTERIMYCSLNEEYLPPLTFEVCSNFPAKVNLEIIKVFDTEIEEWRSFKVKSVTQFRAVA